MIDWNNTKYEDLKSMHFDSIDPEDSGINRSSPYENVGAFRATPGQIKVLQGTEDKNILDLRKKILNHMHEKIKNAANIYEKASTDCALSESLIRKVMDFFTRPRVLAIFKDETEWELINNRRLK
jgi:hypothetical protein